MVEPAERPTCFIAMPITTHPDQAKLYGGDEDHWDHVMRTLFERAIEQAGFEPIRPAADGANLIHGLIIQNLSKADLVLVDLSTHNPNVFFELGVRTSIDRPIALVRDEHTSLPFDISGINAYQYDSRLLAWELERQQEALARHITASFASCDGHNPLWRKFGLTIKASEPDADESPLEAKLDLLTSQLARVQNQLRPERAATRDDVWRVWDESATITGIYADDLIGLGMLDNFVSAVNGYLGKRYPHAATLRRIDGAVSTAEIFTDHPMDDKDIARIREFAEKYRVDATFRYPDRSFKGLSPHDLARRAHDGADRLGSMERID
jgi:hypothetical protein